MKFDVNKYYNVDWYSPNGFRKTIENGFKCKMLASHCEYDAASGLYINHNTDCAYDITEYHK